MPTPDPDKQTLPIVGKLVFTIEQLQGLAKDLDRYTEKNPDCSYFTANDGARVRWLLAQSATQLQELQRAKREAQELRAALEGLVVLYDVTDEQLSMDQVNRNLAVARQALARPAHTEGLADKGGEA